MKRKRPKRTRIAIATYSDMYGVSIFVRGKEYRFPLGTSLETLKRERTAKIAEAGPLAARKGTLSDDVLIYLATMPADVTTGIDRRRRQSDARMLLQHWLQAPTTFEGRAVTFAQLPREAITAVMVKTQLASWRSAGLAESTCDHRRRELGTLYNVLNGKEGYNPVRAVPKYAPTYDDPRGFDLGVMDLILDNMPDRGRPNKGERKKDGTISTVSTAKIRLRVMRHCGIPPQTLKKVQPGDINFVAKTLHTKQRRKGDGAKGRVLPLTSKAVDALRAFNEYQLYGWFDQRAVNRSFKRSATQFRKQWKKDHPHTLCPIPDDLHAYDLRHGFLSDVYRKTRNKKAVGHLAGHTDNSPLTDRYVQAAVDDVARAAIAVVESASNTQPRLTKKYGKVPIKRSVKTAPRTRRKDRGKA